MEWRETWIMVKKERNLSSRKTEELRAYAVSLSPMKCSSKRAGCQQS